MSNNYTFFFKADSPFSQFHESHFTINGQQFCCGEQAMMYAKAMLFNAPETAEKILQCNPTEQRRMKSLGRRGVPNFDQEVWDANKYDIVKQNNIAKFTQNENLKQILLDTYPTQLVEASPYDRIWGIGYSATKALNVDKEQWGQNLLGKILTEVRDELM